jgi:hypothetical protein
MVVLQPTVQKGIELLARFITTVEDFQTIEKQERALQIIHRTYEVDQTRIKSMKTTLEHPNLRRLDFVPELIEKLAAISPRINRLRDIGMAIEGAVEDRELIRFNLNESLISLGFTKQELETVLSQTETCPFSGGEFFEECKETIRQEEQS